MASIKSDIRAFSDHWKTVDRNVLAALMSVVPGAGHLYKHHYVSGFGILVAGNILVVFVSVLLGLATFGVSLILLPLVYWASVAASAYYIPDWHGHHQYLHPSRKAHQGPVEKQDEAA